MRNINREGKGLALCTSVLRSSPPGRTVTVALSSGWRLVWALDSSEHPLPSGIVGRLDAEETLGFVWAMDHENCPESRDADISRAFEDFT